MKISLVFLSTLLVGLVACEHSGSRQMPEPSPTWSFDYTVCTHGTLLENEILPRNEGCPETALRIVRERSDIEEPLVVDPVTGWTVFRCDIWTGGGHISGCQVQRLCAISADGQAMHQLTGACASMPFITSPDGQWLITVTESPQNRPCHVNLVKMRFDGSESQVLAGAEWKFCNIFSLEWSSDLDGDWVRFQAIHGDLRVSRGYRARVAGRRVEQINLRFVPSPTPTLPFSGLSNHYP